MRSTPNFCANRLSSPSDAARSFEVDEMRLHAPLGEEAQRLAGVGVLLDAEDLNFHGPEKRRVMERADVITDRIRASRGNLRQW